MLKLFIDFIAVIYFWHHLDHYVLEGEAIVKRCVCTYQLILMFLSVHIVSPSLRGQNFGHWCSRHKGPRP